MGSSKKILIVEDEAVIAMDIRSSLAKNDYVVTDHVTKGEDVIRSIHKNKPDLILMDVKLDGVFDGIETAQIVHEYFDIPVIFITSFSNKNIIERAKQTNPFGYIVKPFEDRELFTNIEIAFFKHEVEIKLKESEKKYRELSESIHQIILECEIDGLITYVNEPGMQMLGITYPELEKGVYLSSFISTENFEKIIERYQQSPTQFESNNKREYLLVNKLGKHIYIEEYTSPVYFQGVLFGLRGILIDITSKKLKENLNIVYHKIISLYKEAAEDLISIIKFILKEFKALFFYIEDVYFNELDLKSNFLIKHSDKPTVSRVYANGLSEYVIKHQMPLYLRGPELAEFNYENGITIFGETAVCWCGFPVNNDEGTLGVFAIQSYINKNALTKGDFESLASFFTNIQAFFDRISYLKQLKRSQEKYKNLVNSITEGIIQVDFNNVVVFVNDQLCDLIGYKKEEIIGKYIFDAFSFNDEKKSFIANKILGTKDSFNRQFQLELIARSGLKKEVVLNISPLTNESGKLIGILGTVVDVTEKINYLKQINESEQKFKAIFEQAAVGVAVVNSQTGYVIDANEKYCEILEYPYEEITQKNFIELTYEEDLEFDIVQMKRLINGEIAEFTLEKRLYKKSGELVWVNLTVSPLWKNGETATSHIAILENISKKKIIEEKLLSSELEKESILRAIPDSFAVISNKGIVISSYFKNNEAIIKHDIYESVNGKPINSAFIESVSELIKEGMKNALNKKSLFQSEFELEGENKASYFEFRFIRINTENVLIIIRNITDIKRNILEIQKFFNITDQTKELIMITDKNGKIEYVNPMFTEVTGYKLTDVYGLQPSVFKSNKHPKSFFTELWREIISGNTYKLTVTNRKKNGELYIEEKIITPLINEKGEIINFISTGRDITEEIKRERKILTYQKFEKTLEKKEQKYRTLSLIQGQENERKRIAREIHDGLGQMLTVVKANVESIRNEELDPIERSAKTEIVNQMVAEVIQETRRISHNLSPVGLYEFGLEAVILQLVKRINMNVEDVVIEYKSDLGKTRFKSETEINLFRIIQESIQNSLKHSKCKKVLVNMRYSEDQFKLLIKDDGIGFNIKQLENASKHQGGIRNIEERAKIIDAKLVISTEVGEGFSIMLTMKIKK